MSVTGSAYASQHPDYTKNLQKWSLIKDVLEGEIAVKFRKQLYLPLENTERDANRYKERYKVYIQRAKLYNATARTLAGFVGQVFNKQPAQEFPAELSYLKDDPTGTGANLEQFAKGITGDVVSFGRCGIWIDFPKFEKGYSVKDVTDGVARPTLKRYNAVDVVNWRTIQRGARTLLSLIVLREQVLVDSDDEFVAEYRYQYRVLRLRNNIYTVQVYRDWESVESPATTPLNHKGEPFDEIPFVFIGIKENDSTVDDAPMYDMASLNISHYVNSADYEEACFMVGQPMLWYAGIDKGFADDFLPDGVRVGSRGGLPLPPGGAAGLLQAASNGMVKEAMDQKEAQMIALGARIIRESGVAKTATEVTGDKVTEVSTLAAAARNTSAGLRKAFEFAQKFAGTSAEIKFELATDFDMTTMTSQMLLAIVATWQAGLMVSEDVHDVFTRAGFTNLTFEQAKTKGMLNKPPEPPVATGSPAARSDNQASKI